MYKSATELRSAGFADLVSFSRSKVPTLRQMHAIEEMARRSLVDPALLDAVVPVVVLHLGHSSRMGGLPVGYPAASLLYRAGGATRNALLVAIGSIRAQVRDDLLRWLTPSIPETASALRAPPAIDRDLLIEECVPSDVLRAALSVAMGRPIDHERFDLPGRPALLVMVSLTLPEWARFDEAAEHVAASLGCDLYLFGPEALGGLHPDLRVRVRPNGLRGLVTATGHPSGGYRIAPYPG
ncbi:MAG: hypothetical protein ABMA64_37850 [Myxococcota bacterium]